MMKLFPMKLQLFADGSGSAGSGSGNAGDGSGTTGTAGGTNGQTPQAIDYAKIQQVLDGTLRAKEDTALKAYFKQQGPTEEETNQAIAAFKQQKAQNQPTQIESVATVMAVSDRCKDDPIRPEVLVLSRWAPQAAANGIKDSDVICEGRKLRFRKTKGRSALDRPFVLHLRFGYF